MRKIKKPEDQCLSVYTTCIGIVRNNNLKLRLTAGQYLIPAAFQEFEKKVTKGQLYTIKREKFVNGNISQKELEEVYTLRMARKGAAGRPTYDKIISSAVGGICPMCSQREATTVDHYLPKSEYPRLTVVPVNLIPCCKDCNDIKDVLYPKTSGEEFIHPYYDNIESDIWLDAEIVHTSPCSFRYFVTPPGDWPHLLGERMEYHFRKLELAKLYSTQAAVELSMIRYRLSSLLASKGGIRSVTKYLSEAEETRSQANVNSWQAVFYRAAKRDVWFKKGGFK